MNMIRNYLTKLGMICSALSIGVASQALASPVLNFSDLISGPDVGLGDGKGSGAIVTVWGQNLGDSQGNSKIEFCDSSQECRAGYVYYWKRADAQLPSGPANLYESHKMHEIAFSIPDSAQGPGFITVTVGSEVSRLPFTVRSGKIYHVRSNGNDSSGDGSWSNPWKSVGNAENSVDDPGSTIYVGSVVQGSPTTDKALYWNNGPAKSGIENQFSFVAYPNSRPELIGHRGVSTYKTEGLVVSKMSIFSAAHDVDSNDQPVNQRAGVSIGISGSRNGRAVGNYITDEHPSDANGACASGTQGAIKANNLNALEVESYKILGNMIYEYGCYGSNKLHHTTYISIRSGSDNDQVKAPEMGFNYLKDNKAKNGLHYYDENQTGDLCGQFTTDFNIHNNVIVNQAGAGINVGAACPVSTDINIYNNVIINSGLASDWDGRSITTANGPNTGGIVVGDRGLSGKVAIYNNTVYKWNDDGLVADTQACIGLQGDGNGVDIELKNNICWTDKDKPFVNHGCCGADVLMDNVRGDGNLFFTAQGGAKSAIAPSWDSSALTSDPLLTVLASRIEVDKSSAATGRGASSLERDIYGTVRPASSTLGAVEPGNDLSSGGGGGAAESPALPPPNFRAN